MMATVLTFILLALSVIGLWFSGNERAPVARRSLWLLFLGVALVAGFIAGVLQPAGALFAVLFAATAMLYFLGMKTNWGRWLLALAIVAWSAGLMLHRLPGFLNPRVIFQVRFTPDAIPFSLYLNLDKTLVGILILGFGHRLATTRDDWRIIITRAAPIAAVTIVVVLFGSLAAGYVHFAPKLPRETALWFATNLLFVCTAEEALFRGFIQTELTKLWAGTRYGAVAALAIAAFLFGLAHFAGGPTYVALATLAGAGYGWAYLRTGRIEASILTHVTLNSVHFLLFTYPALAR